jgi:AsmA protein
MIKTITIKTLKFLGIIIGFLVTAIIIFSLVVQLFFKDQLTQYLIAELSKQLNAKIDIDYTEFLFWKTFPNASVGLHKVLVHPATEYIKYNIVHTNTLLAADEVIFEFNIVKLLSNNYVLNKIKVLQGKFNLEIDPLGNANYNIFKKSKGSGPELTLKNIILRQCVINYSNLQSDVFIKAFSNRSDIQAVIHNKKFDFDISTRLFIEHVVIQKICYVNQHAFSSKGNVKITNNVYSFNI